MKKTIIKAAAATLAVVALAGCSTSGEVAPAKKRTLTDAKVGLICLHDNSSTYDKNFIDSVNNAVANAGLAESQLLVKTNVDESADCKTAAEELVEQGCNLVIADSFGHEPYLKEVAASHPEVEFLHCTGVSAQSSGLDNFHNAFASIYEGRYLAGVAAGLKLNEMITEKPSTAHKVGYVGAFTYAEVISGYTAWYLGVKQVVKDVTMDVQFTGSWYDPTAEKTAAETLIEKGAVLLSQHADSMGAPNACEERGVPNVSYNGSTYAACPNTFIVSSRIDWTFIFEQYILGVATGDKVQQKDTIGTMGSGSVKLTDVGSAAAARTQAYLDQCAGLLNAGLIKVFDASTFTIKGAAPTSETVRPGSATWSDYDPSIDLLEDGYYHESQYRSAPSFDVEIDGITLLNREYGEE